MGVASTMFQKLHDAGFDFAEDIVSAKDAKIVQTETTEFDLVVA